MIPRLMTEWAHTPHRHRYHPGAGSARIFYRSRHRRVIGETCEIGRREVVSRCNLGARSFQRDEQGRVRKGGKRHPNVEDYVTIYPNSSVLGGETVVGARSTIGGNVFLLQSVPPDSLVYYEAEQVRVVPKHPHAKTGRDFPAE